MAAEDVGSLIVRIEADLRDFQNGINQVNNRVETFGSRIRKIGGVIAGAFAVKAVVGFGESMIMAASDAEEMQSKFNTVFGEMSETTEDWAKNFQNAVGGSRVEIKSMLADSADLLAGFGATEEQAFDLSTRMQSLGTDIASFSNIQGGAEEAVDRLRKGLMGETENLKALGIVINQKMLQDELMAIGDTRKLKDLTELEKMELRYTIAVRQSANAIGDAERTSAGFANQIRNLRGKIKDLVASLGTRLLPIATKIVTFLVASFPKVEAAIDDTADAINNLTNFFSRHWDIIEPILIGIAAGVVTFGFYTLAINAATIATRIATVVARAFGATMTFIASPIGLVVVAIGALVATGVYLYKNWDIVRLNMLKIFNNLSHNVQSAMSFMKIKVLSSINTILKGFEKFSDFIPGLNKTITIARNKISNMIDAEKVKKNTRTFIHATNQASYAVKLQEIEIKKLDDANKDTTLATEKLIKTKKIEKDAIRKSTKAIEESEKAQKKATETAKKLREETIKNLDNLGEAIKKALIKRYETEEKLQINSLTKQSDTLRKQTDENLNQYDKEYAAKLKLFDAESSAELKALQIQINAINNQTDAEEKAIEEREYQEELAIRKKELAEAKTAEEKLSLTAKLNDMLADRERKNLLESRKKRISAIRDEMDSVRTRAEKKRKAMKIELEEKKKHEKLLFEEKQKGINAEMKSITKHYNILKTEEALQNEARKLVLDKNNKEVIDLLEKYNPKWQDVGQSFGESLILGLNSTKQSIKNVVNEIFSLIDNARTGTGAKVSSYIVKSGDTLSQVAMKFKTTVSELAKLNKIADINLIRVGQELKLPAFAKGVQNFKGGMALVGEKGPELVNLPKGSDVIPNNQIGTGNVNFEGMFKGAIFNVRSDNDIKLIAREIYNLQKQRSRGSGVVFG